MKQTPKKRFVTPKNLQLIVTVILALIAGGMAINVERPDLRLEIRIGRSA